MAERCKNCGKLVEYQLIGSVYPGGKSREETIWPYCGFVLESRMTSQYYFVRGLEDENGSDGKKKIVTKAAHFMGGFCYFCQNLFSIFTNKI